MLFDKSAALIAENAKTIAGGINSNFRIGMQGGPLVFQRGEGPYLIDADGNRLIDYYCGMGAMVLGHTPAGVQQAVKDQVDKGILYAGQSEVEFQAARILCERIASARRIRFGSSGSEVVQAAFRLARAATAKRIILKFEGHYHGWFDNILWSTAPSRLECANAPVKVAGSAGQEAAAGDGLDVIGWNDLGRLEARLARGDIAGVIMEPAMCNQGAIAPAAGYLEGALAACRRHGALLIFDEVITGFRLDRAGAQARFGVTPDLSLFAKAIANGFPVAAIAGRADLLDLFASGGVLHGGTFNAQPVAMAAMVATQQALTPELYEGWSVRGVRLRDGLRAILNEAGIKAQVTGFELMFHIGFGLEAPARDYRDLLKADKALYVKFVHALLGRGVRVLERGAWFVSAAHDDAVIDATLDAARGAGDSRMTRGFIAGIFHEPHSLSGDLMLDRRAMLGAALGASAWPAQAQANGRRIINAMMTDEPASLCYPLFNTRLAQEICGNINESLLLFDWQFRPRPNLARAFEMTPDGLTYTFHLRPDVVWHDGVPFTARDVAFSCGVMLPQLNPRSRNAFSHIARIETPDRWTAVVHLKQPFNAFLLSLMASSAPMMPAHIYEGTDFRTNPFNFKPIGTGPFRFAEWKRGQYIHLERNPRYWRRGQPGMDAIYYRLCPTPEQRMVAIETGAVDLALADDIDTVVNSRLVANPDLVASTDAYNGTGEITVMELNMRRWPFGDRRFRAAFLHAVDREFLVAAINFGLGKVAHGPIPSTAPYYDAKALTRYPYDPARARALLNEMGLKPKLGGVRHRFGIMLTPDGGGAWTRGAQYIKQALLEVGLEAQLEATDWPTFSQRSGNWDFDCDCNSYGEYGDPAIGTSRFFVSSNIRKGVPQTNIQGYINPEVDALFAKAAIAISRDEAQAHYSRLQQILTQDAAMLWMYERKPMLFYNRRLTDVVTGPNGPCDGFGAARLA